MINQAQITDRGMLIEVRESQARFMTSDRAGSVKGDYQPLNGTLKRLKIARHPLGQTWVMVINDMEARCREGEE
jgi:hypothetical protein